MNDGLLTWVILLTGFLSLVVGSVLVRRRRTPYDLRKIEAYKSLPLLIDASVESNHPTHLSFGNSIVGQETTLNALASADVMYYLVRRLSFSNQVPVVTMSDPITLAVAADTLRRAYLARDNLDALRPAAAAWFPQGERSMTFAAGAANFAAGAGAGNHILLGTFGPELALLGESGIRRGQPVIAHSAMLDGQAVAYALSETPLIGEELFVGGAYLNRQDTARAGSLIALDVLRWSVIIFGILLGILVNAVN